jgi:Flp pilus assembly protein TadG
MSRQPAKSRRRGNFLTEFSLIALPMMALLTGIMDVSMLVYARISLQHAVREGVRYAITWNTQTGQCHSESIKNVVRSNSMGWLNKPENFAKVQVKFYNAETLAGGAKNDPGNVVEVSVEDYEWKWVVPLWRSTAPMKMSVFASDRLEGLPAGSNSPCMVNP